MIHYIAYYSAKDNQRASNLAGEDKIDYITEVLHRRGEPVMIVSNFLSI